MPDLDPPPSPTLPDDAAVALRRYGNRTGRGTGPALRAASWVLPGVRTVLAQAGPYADVWTRVNQDALARPGRRWVVVGDSMSQSVGAAAWDAGWVGQLHRSLAASGHDLVIVNLSATGARVGDVLEQQLPLLDRLPPVDGGGPDLVTVLVGSNDLFAAGAVRRSLPAAFAELVDALPRNSVMGTLTQPHRAARRANTHVARAGVEGHVEVVDMVAEGPRTWRGRLAPDRFHPNEAGYAEIARAFRPHVLDVLHRTAVTT